MRRSLALFTLPAFAVIALAALLAPACGPSGPTGGPVTGAADTHCAGMPAQPTSQASCMFVPDMAGPQPDGGTDTGPTYGDTMYDTEGDDDDCKYHVKWSVTDIREKEDVTFTVVATRKTDGTPLTGAAAMAQIYLGDTVALPEVASVESPPGTYTFSHVQFTQPGQWIIRYHFFESCFDYADDSPHGHAAFYLTVP